MNTFLSSSSARIDKLTAELEESKKTGQEKEENEKQLKGELHFDWSQQCVCFLCLENARKWEKSAAHYEKECLSLKSLYEDAEEQIRSTKVALENSYR